MLSDPVQAPRRRRLLDHGCARAYPIGPAFGACPHRRRRVDL